MDSVPPGDEAEVNAEAGAALLSALRQWKEEGAADGSRQHGAADEESSDEEVA